MPQSIDSVASGQDYYVEVWASDVGGTNTGLTSVYVDMIFAPSDAALVQSVSHGGIFTVFSSDTADTGRIGLNAVVVPILI